MSPDTDDTVRWRVLFSGHVQGVGFRENTRLTALGHDVSGYVKNLGDGRVELVAEGQTRLLQAFVDDVGKRLAHRIDTQTIDRMAANGEFRGFEVRY